MRKKAQLTSSLLTKKGEALPTSLVTNEKYDIKVKQETPTPYYKALTVKLNRSRYEILKSLGVQLDKKSQEIFIEALDLYFKSIKK